MNVETARKAKGFIGAATKTVIKYKKKPKERGGGGGGEQKKKKKTDRVHNQSLFIMLD